MNEVNKELSLQDVEFLQAVRYIEDHADEFSSVGEDGRATTEALNSLLMKEWSSVNDWSARKVSYRMNQPGKGDGSRGWGVEGGFGLVRLFQAELTPEAGWTSRKVELTEKGRKQLTVAEENMGVKRSSDQGEGEAELDSTATANELRLSELEEQIEEIGKELEETRSTMQSIAEDVNTIKQSESGAISGEMEEQLGEVFNRIVQHTRLYQSVLGVDTTPFSSDVSPSEEEYQVARQQIRSTLLPSEGGEPSVSESPGEESSTLPGTDEGGSPSQE